MDQKPKKSKKYAFPYLFLGLLIALILVGVLSVLYLISQKQPITLNNLIQLHTTPPTSLLFLYVDIIALYSAVVFGFVGYQKEQAVDSRRYVEWLTQNQQQEILQVQEGKSKLGKVHQDEITRLNEQLATQGTKFQDLEAIIQRGKQQWEATFDAVNDLIILTDETGSIFRCNRATGEVFQLGYSQIIGQRIDDLFSNDSINLLGMVPDEKKDMKAPQKDLWYEVSKNHLLVDGRQQGWVYIFRNITIQKQAFRDQQRLTQYYGLLVNNSPIAIVTLDQDDRIVDCNPAFESMFLYNKKEAIGSKVDQLISSPDQVLENRMMAETVRKGGKVQSITQRRRKDGSLLDVEVFGIPVIMGGKQVGSLGLYHDVSDLVRHQKVSPAIVEQVIVEATEPLGPVIEPEGEEQQLPALKSNEDVEGTSPVIQTQKRLIPIEEIEGIGPVYGQKLADIGVVTTADLLEQGKNRKGRGILVEKTGISSVLVLKWVNMADLMRIHGIGEEYSVLLEKAGVDTVKELRNRNPKNLFEALVQANEAHKLVQRVPHLSEVESWIKEAKQAEPIMTY
jgi:PAS domain S-box-containing protein